MEIEKLLITGPDSTEAPMETHDFLGRLLTRMMYGEIDQVVTMIMKLDHNQRMDLDQAANNLSLLCSIDY